MALWISESGYLRHLFRLSWESQASHKEQMTEAAETFQRQNSKGCFSKFSHLWAPVFSIPSSSVLPWILTDSFFSQSGTFIYLFIFGPKLAAFSVFCRAHTVPGLIPGFYLFAAPLEHSLSCTDCWASGLQTRPRILGFSHPGREDQA